jgi:hypothetical protein
VHFAREWPVFNMSSTAATSTAPVKALGRRRWRSIVVWLEAQALLVTALAAVAVFSLAKLPLHISQDSWLALIGGRYLAAHGIPHHDALFAITHGARWIDQQWLGQLFFYGVHQIGGLALYGIVYVAFTIAGITLAIMAGRALGGSERHVLWTLPLAGGLYFAGSLNVRTQGLALPLFSAVLWLLAREVRGSRDRRIYLVFPLLILWGNLHGSVTLGVGLAMVCGVVLLVGDVLRGLKESDGSWRAGLQAIRSRSLLLLLASPICLLINPYGPEIVAYYKETIFNPAFAKVVTEWQPITTVMVLAIPFFVVAFAVVWVIGRSGRQMPVFDQVALIILCAGAVFAIRNITWFGLGVMILLPRAITALLGPGKTSTRRTSLNLTMAGLSLLVVLGITVAVAVKPASWFERQYSTPALNAVERIAAQQPTARIYADNRFADWLFWEDPKLAGRIAYDIRFELLTTSQLQQIVDVTEIPRPGEQNLVDGYRVLVLDPGNGDTTQRLLARSGTDVVVRSKNADVATWTPPA